VSWLGDRMVAVALAFAVLELGGSATDVGVVLACRTLPTVAFLLAGGVIADRLSPRTVMVAADLFRLVTQGLMAALLIAGAAEVWSVALLAALTGAGTGFFNPASTGVLPAVVAPERLQQANGLRATVMSGGEIVGPALAGVIVAAAGAGWALAVDAASFAISALFLARVRLPARAEREPASFLSDLREGWDEFRVRRWVWTFVLWAGLANLLWGAWSALGPVVADRELGGAAAWGTVLAAMGVGALVGSVLAVRARPRRPLLLAAATLNLFAIPIGALAAGVPVAILAGAALFAGVATMLGNSLWESTLQRHIPASSLSRVAAYDWFGSLAFQPIGLIVWGPVAEAIGLGPALWTAFALFVALNLALLSVPDVWRLREPAGAH
jgi:MFS family permease